MRRRRARAALVVRQTPLAGNSDKGRQPIGRIAIHIGLPEPIWSRRRLSFHVLPIAAGLDWKSSLTESEVGLRVETQAQLAPVRGAIHDPGIWRSEIEISARESTKPAYAGWTTRSASRRRREGRLRAVAAEISISERCRCPDRGTHPIRTEVPSPPSAEGRACAAP